MKNSCVVRLDLAFKDQASVNMFRIQTICVDQHFRVTDNIVQPNTVFTCNSRLFTICVDLLFLLTESMLTEHLVDLRN